MQPEEKNDGRLIQSVDRAIRILELFDSENVSIGISEMARLLDINKSTVFGLVATLEHHGFLVQEKGTSKYKLGMKLFQMGCNVVGTLDVRDVAHEGLQKLVTEFQEVAAHLVTYDRGEVIYLDKLEGYRTISIVSKIGWRYPMYATGVGKVMLAFLGDQYLQANILSSPMKKFTPNTIVDGTSLKEEMKAIRARGYAVDSEEMLPGIACVAFPIFDFRGDVAAAVSLSGATSSLYSVRRDEMVAALGQLAGQVSAQLGYQTR